MRTPRKGPLSECRMWMMPLSSPAQQSDLQSTASALMGLFICDKSIRSSRSTSHQGSRYICWQRQGRRRNQEVTSSAAGVKYHKEVVVVTRAAVITAAEFKQQGDSKQTGLSLAVDRAVSSWHGRVLMGISLAVYARAISSIFVMQLGTTLYSLMSLGTAWPSLMSLGASPWMSTWRPPNTHQHAVGRCHQHGLSTHTCGLHHRGCKSPIGSAMAFSGL